MSLVCLGIPDQMRRVFSFAISMAVQRAQSFKLETVIALTFDTLSSTHTLFASSLFPTCVWSAQHTFSIKLQKKISKVFFTSVCLPDVDLRVGVPVSCNSC